jgi:hypothetical protein
MSRRTVTLLVLAMAIASIAKAAVSVSIAVPADVQLALFRNIWKLDRNFDGTKQITLAIVYQESYSESVAAKDDLLAAIAQQKLPVVPILIDAKTQQLLSSRLHDVDAEFVYVAPLRALDVSEIGRIGRSRPFRTLTGVPEYVEQGIAVGIGLRRDRPLIIVNLEQSRAEGASFSSQLLALARIVGPVQ